MGAGNIHRNYMSISHSSVVVCLNCESRLQIDGEVLFDTRFGIATPYWIARCESCGLEQTVPLPTGKELNALYEKYYNFGGEQGEPENRYVQLRKILQNSQLWNLWLKIDGDISFHAIRGKGRLLDVGCNEGRGLIRYQSSGYSVEGLELNSKAADVARRKGFIVHSDLIELFQPVAKYDVVVLSNVLEHSLNPTEMLTNVARILKPGGRVWISCPNSESWLRSFFGKFWINWHVPFHISHFSSKTLRSILSQAGFELKEWRQETPALWVTHSIIARLFAKPRQPTKQLRSVPLVVSLILLIRGFFFPLLWLGNLSKRGDCLVVIARKS